MSLFPFTAPRLGLHLAASGLNLVEVHRSWWSRRAGVRLRRCTERALPEGLIRPSATEPNVADVAALAGEIRAELEARRAATVALTLPDQCARVGLLEFESLPRNTSDCTALIRWRIQQELNLSATDTRVAFRIFRSPHGAEPPSRIAARVLAVAIRQEILEQYERACEQASLWPVSVGLASLRVFDLCRPAMAAATSRLPGEVLFASVGEGGISFVALRHGSPIFLRRKALRNGAAVDRAGEHLSNELVATLQYYADVAAPQSNQAGTSRPLFLVSDRGQAVLDPSAAEALRVQVIPIGWDVLPVQADRAHTGSFAGLAAMAGVAAA